MNLIETQKLIIDAFNSNKKSADLPEGTQLRRLKFKSPVKNRHKDNISSNFLVKYNILPKRHLTTNSRFNYYIFLPKERTTDEVILLLHGLNERSWDKYLLWAHYLATNSKKPVIIFPIAYHINRAPEAWSNPRLMSEISKSRIDLSKDEKLSSSFANVALSLRLSHAPELFYQSGLQTYFDIIKLVKNIKKGRHKYLSKDSRINFFSYSIGAFLTEVLLLSNPDNLFTNQKAFLFCGGSTFDKINAVSRSILDKEATQTLSNYIYNGKANYESIRPSKKYAPYMAEAWKSFKMMLNKNIFTNERIEKFTSLRPIIKAVGLVKDSVIPANAILETVGECEIIDFPVNYSHENPFPFNNKSKTAIVEEAFISIFEKAISFFK